MDGSQALHLVDYKTGKLKEERLRGITKGKPNGGNYWRQLLFYKILVEQANVVPYVVRAATIDYLTPTEEGIFPSRSLKFAAEEVTAVKDMIQQVYQKITAHQFSEGCGERGCKWCNFAQRNQLPDTFSDPTIEALDDR
jgi:DNA helicase-2/ATP-dependent DNA helicase PcrA